MSERELKCYPRQSTHDHTTSDCDPYSMVIFLKGHNPKRTDTSKGAATQSKSDLEA